MAEEAIVINEPYEIAKDFEAGTLLNVNGRLLKVVLDDEYLNSRILAIYVLLILKG